MNLLRNEVTASTPPAKPSPPPGYANSDFRLPKKCEPVPLRPPCQPHSAPANSPAAQYYVRHQTTHSMKLIAFFFTFFAASLFCRGETTISGTQEGRALSVSSNQAQQIEKLATALLVSSDYEAARSDITTEARWQQTLGASHIHIVFSELRKFSFQFSTTGPATVQTVSADEVLIPISREHSPDYVFVRFHGHVRAFAKFSCDACTALQKILSPRSHQ